MRTKNAKRLWPVPATLAVMALAAFLAFGLLAAPGPQPVEAHTPGGDYDHCDDGVNNAGDSAIIECTTTADSFDLKLLGGTTQISYWVYSTGIGSVSSDSINDDIDVSAVVDTITAEISLAEITVDVPATNRTPVNSETVTIQREDADDGDIYLFITDVAAAPIDDDNSVLTTSDVETTVKVTFLGKPAKDDDDDEAPEGSTLTAPALAGNETSVIFTLTLRDSNGNPLTTDNSAANVVVIVDDPTNKATINGIRTNSRLVNLGADVDGDNGQTDGITVDDANAALGLSQFTVSGLPKSGAVEIPVSVTINNARGDLTLTKDASRVGDAETITSMTYWCDPSKEREADAAADLAVSALTLCQSEAEALASKTDSDDPSPRSVFAPGQTFIIVSKAVDELQQELKQNVNNTDAVDLMAEEVTADDEDEAGFEIEDETGPHPDGDDPTTDDRVETETNDQKAKVAYIMVLVPDADNIDTGTYNFKVQDTGKKAETTISISVSGEPESYEITGDMWIPLDGEKTYTVTATDENGNIPAAVAADYMAEGEYAITVRVRGTTLKQADDVVGLSTAGMLMVNAGKGTGTFTILAPVEASQGDSATIRVIVNDVVEDTFTVHFGDVLMMPGMMPGMPMNVMAMATSHDMITVTWDAAADGGSDITGYMVQRGYMDADNMMMWMDVDPAHMGMDMMYMDMGLMAETTYYYRVSATNSVGMGDYSDGTAMAMTMAENMAPMASEEGIADQMVDAGSYVMVDVSGAFSDADMDMLTYSAESDMMDYATVSVDGSMVTITGVAEGTATITVTAMDPDGMSAMQTIMVTVMMMPPMELGPAMNLMATANDDGSIMLSWTAGTDANLHFVSGNLGAIAWEYASEMNMHTVPADQLMAGEEYTFHVLSGYWMKDEAGSWQGMWAPSGWSNAAMATAMAGN